MNIFIFVINFLFLKFVRHTYLNSPNYSYHTTFNTHTPNNNKIIYFVLMTILKILGNVIGHNVDISLKIQNLMIDNNNITT